MPMPKGIGAEDYFVRLEPYQRPHLEALRDLSRRAAPHAREVLKWNQPTYVLDDNTTLRMLQNFKHHCSLRFTPEFFAPHQSRVAAAGGNTAPGSSRFPMTGPCPSRCSNPSCGTGSVIKARSKTFRRP